MRSVILVGVLLVTAARAQSQLGDAWFGKLRSDKPGIRISASYDFTALRKIPLQHLTVILATGARDSDPLVRAQSMAAFGELLPHSQSAVPTLKQALLDRDATVRLQAAISMAKYRKDALSALIHVVRSGPSAFPASSENRSDLFYANCGNPMFTPSFLAALALGQIGVDAAPDVLSLIHDELGKVEVSNAPDLIKKNPKLSIRLVQRHYYDAPYAELALKSMGPNLTPILIHEMPLAKGAYKTELASLLAAQSNRRDIPLNMATELFSDEASRDQGSEILGNLGSDGQRYLLAALSGDDVSKQLAALRVFERRDRADNVSLQPAIAELLGKGSAPQVTIAALRVLQENAALEPRLWPIVMLLAVNRNKEIAEPAQSALANKGTAPEGMIDELNPALTAALDGSPNQQHGALVVLSHLGPSAAPFRATIASRTAMLAANDSADSDDIKMCLTILSSIDPHSAVAILIGMLQRGGRFSEIAVGGLGDLGSQAKISIPHLAQFLSAKQPSWLRYQAGQSIARLGTEGKVELEQLCRDQNDVQVGACEAVARNYSDDESLRLVLLALETPTLATDVLWALTSRTNEKCCLASNLTVISTFADLQPEVERVVPLFAAGINASNDSNARAWMEGIARIGPPARALAPLLLRKASLLPNGVDEDTIRQALKNIGEGALPALGDVLKSGKATPRILGFADLFGSQVGQYLDFIKGYLKADDATVRAAALSALIGSDVPFENYSAEVVLMSNDAEPHIRLNASRALIRTTHDKSLNQIGLQVLVALFEVDAVDIREAAAEEVAAVGAQGKEELNHALTSIATDKFLKTYLERSQREFYNAHFKTCMSGEFSTLPPFPWPPPQFSERDVVPRRFLGNDMSTLAEVDSVLESALKQTGYGSGGVFSIPGGFVRVTKVERIDENGKPFPDKYRWMQDQVPPRSFLEYLGQLFLQNPGLFRFFVFAVTDNWVGPDRDKHMDFREATNLFLSGAPVLSSEIRKQPFAGRECYVLIYEFEKSSDKTWELVPSPLNAETHLVRAGLWTILKGKN